MGVDGSAEVGFVIISGQAHPGGRTSRILLDKPLDPNRFREPELLKRRVMAALLVSSPNIASRLFCASNSTNEGSWSW